MPSPLPPLAVQYTDFTMWQREWLQGRTLDEQLGFWSKRLEGLQPLDLPTDKKRPPIPSFTGARETVHVPHDAGRRLRELCEREGVTPFMTLLCAFQALLHRYSGQDDIAVGCPIANRNRPELEPLIGFFVNTLVMRVDCSGNPTCRQLLKRVGEMALSAYAHQDLPFERLVEHLQPDRDPSRNPLFQVTFQIIGGGGESNGDGATADLLRTVDVELATSKFDLRCDLWPSGDGFDGHLEDSRDLFEPETIRAMARHFETLVAAMVSTPDRAIGDVPLVASPEQRKLLAHWNDTAFTHHRSKACIHQFEAIAAASAEALAAQEGKVAITYGELNRRANQLARTLMSRGVQRGCLVVLLLDRSIDLVTAVLGVAKAGCAYVPLDPAYPRKRLSTMIHDALAPVLVTTSRHRALVPEYMPQIVLDADAESLAREDSSNPQVRIDDQCLAYVIFTSGSTGKPRGVEILHAGLNNLVDWHCREYAIAPADRATLYASPAFDASVWEMWPYLTRGASLHIPDAEAHANCERLVQWMAEQQITMSFLPTPVAEMFVSAALPPDLSLRALLTGGDKLRSAPLRPLPFRFVNHYGPTECTVVATFCDVDGRDTHGEPAIGRPISNITAHVLDRRGRPVPPGIRGELYLGGIGLARGYLNDAELTKRRFVPSPLERTGGSRLYRTGDLVRQRGDGALEFHGRVDTQIKVRGHRIEPGDIESVLNAHPSIEQCVVAAHESPNGDCAIVAYVVPKKPDDNEPAREHQRVQEWTEIYDELYGQAGERATTFDIVGWNSSYTGAPLSAAAMREQVAGTVGRIAALGGQRILEIGCGTGLLLWELAGGCTRYVATDFSAPAVAAVAREVAARGWDHVEVWCRAADDFSGVAAGAFDVVVLNSVVQYFPGMDYLQRVLAGATRAVRPGGFVFVGDVRNRRLQRLLHAGIECARAEPQTPVGEVRERVARRGRQEVELVIDPALFEQLPGQFGEVRASVVQVKRGWDDHELTRFRYDVVLQVGAAPQVLPSVASRAWVGIEELRTYLQTTRPTAVCVRGVPSRRLGREARLVARLDAAPADVPVHTVLPDPVAAGQDDGVEPEALWALGATCGYEIRVSGAADEATHYDVWAVPAAPAGAPLWVAADAARGALQPWSAYGNALLGRAAPSLVPRLREHLRQQLPEYMVPSTFVCLDALPLTPNGKLHRRALPAPDHDVTQDDDIYAPPETDLHRSILATWTTVIGLERIGIDSNFFNIGGHSLLATQVVSRLSSAMGVEIPLRLVFEKPTVREFAAAVAELQAEPRTATMPPVLRARGTGRPEIDPDALTDEQVDALLSGLLGETASN